MKAKKLAVKNYYDKESYDKDKYTETQIRRWKVKKENTRDSRTYISASKEIKKYLNLDNKDTMLCLGVRNNFERDCFRKYLDQKKVYSLDISPESNADFIADFSTLQFDKKVQVVYSNSIDHCVDPEYSYISWLSCLSQCGILVVDFDCTNSEADAADCSVFSKKSVLEYLKRLENDSLIEILVTPYSSLTSEKYTDGYFRTIVKKR